MQSIFYICIDVYSSELNIYSNLLLRVFYTWHTYNYFNFVNICEGRLEDSYKGIPTRWSAYRAGKGEGGWENRDNSTKWGQRQIYEGQDIPW